MLAELRGQMKSIKNMRGLAPGGLRNERWMALAPSLMTTSSLIVGARDDAQRVGLLEHLPLQMNREMFLGF